MAETADLPKVEIGVITGSGFDSEQFVIEEQVNIGETPFGVPSGDFTIGEIAGVKVATLLRHGQDHQIPPQNLPVRANIYGFKMLGVGSLIGVGAVGSLREEIAPRDLVVPDQLIDRSLRVPKSFFEDDIVAHVQFGEPFCPELRTLLFESAQLLEGEGRVRSVHNGGTYICMEGPQFSTKAESEWHRQMGGSVVGMTAALEAKLAREAEICYTTLALSTDMDAWHPEEEPVTMEMIGANMQANVENAKAALEIMIPKIGERAVACQCHTALQAAVPTRRLDAVPADVRTRFAAFNIPYGDEE